jgi:hypothetical protein
MNNSFNDIYDRNLSPSFHRSRSQSRSSSQSRPQSYTRSPSYTPVSRNEFITSTPTSPSDSSDIHRVVLATTQRRQQSASMMESHRIFFIMKQKYFLNLV